MPFGRFFKLATRDVAIDLGTANTVIYLQGGGIVISIMRIQINADEILKAEKLFRLVFPVKFAPVSIDFSKRITRVEVHISDQDGSKLGKSDKRCLIEARLEGRQPEVASEDASTLELAYSGAAKKLQRALESSLGRLGHLKSADTIRTGDQ